MQTESNELLNLTACDTETVTNNFFANYNPAALFCLRNYSKYQLQDQGVALMPEDSEKWRVPKNISHVLKLEIKLKKCTEAGN
jgi:hypothetical protein